MVTLIVLAQQLYLNIMIFTKQISAKSVKVIHRATKAREQAQKDACDRETRILGVIRDMKNDAKVAAEQQAGMQENRLQYDKALFQEQQEAAEKKRKDREKKEKLKLILAITCDKHSTYALS